MAQPAVAAARAHQPRPDDHPRRSASEQGTYGIRYADIMATSLLGALPLMVVFVLFQRRIVEGIAGTGLKG